MFKNVSRIFNHSKKNRHFDGHVINRTKDSSVKKMIIHTFNSNIQLGSSVVVNMISFGLSVLTHVSGVKRKNQ